MAAPAIAPGGRRMLVTVESAADSSRSVDELLAWCQSPQSRANWPGVERISWDDTTALPRLFYEIEIRAPGAPPGGAHVEEHMCRPEEDDEGVFFESAQLWNWSTGQVSGAWATYRVGETPHGSRLRFVFRYVLGDLGAADVFDRAVFCRSIEHAVDRYVARVVTAGIGGVEEESSPGGEAPSDAGAARPISRLRRYLTGR